MTKTFFLSVVAFALCCGCAKEYNPGVSGVKSPQIEELTAANTINFGGYTWNVTNSPNNKIKPGPNLWKKENIWVDANGYLHLKITKDNVTGEWSCAQVSTQQTFGYGTYQFWVEGQIDKLDKNVVFGLFNHSGNDGYDEMDIEFARWGHWYNSNLNYTVWPAQQGFKKFWDRYEFSLNGTYTTHRFTRTKNSVIFQSLHGHTNGDTHLFASTTCTDPPNSVSTLAMPAFINLYLFQGKAPANDKEVEIIIHSFTFQPVSGTVTDIDGNVYNTVKIGTQVWMKENLKTSHYRNGDAIPTGLSDNDWYNTTSGAYAIYNNDAANNTTYGKLYNWFAVVDARNICPVGWHIPTDAEWTTLINFLGGESVAGGKMKATILWKSPNIGATNESGFKGLPGGFRYLDGTFFAGFGESGFWWSSTEDQTSHLYAWECDLYYSRASVFRSTFTKQNGLSVRCVKN